MIVQALPGAGKTTLATKLGYCDTDVLVEQLGYRGHFDKLLTDKVAVGKFFSAIREADRVGVVLTNLNLDKFRSHVDVRFGYHPDDYVAHIRLAERRDLLEKFSEEELRQWAIDYGKLGNVVTLQAGQYLTSSLINVHRKR